MKRLALTLLAAALALCTPRAARAQSIGVSFYPSDPSQQAPATLAATDVAGAPGFAQTNYNNVDTPTATGLRNSLGLATTAGCSIRATGKNAFFFVGNNADAASGADERFMNGYLSFYSDPTANPSGMLSLTNIPFSSYSVVVYGLGEQNISPVRFTLGATSYYTNVSNLNAQGPGYVDNNPATPFTYTQITSTNTNTPTTNGDYAVFTGLSGASQSLAIGFDGNNDGQANISGFQIIDTSVVPEPSTWALLAIGSAALGLAALRRRRAVLPA